MSQQQPAVIVEGALLALEHLFGGVGGPIDSENARLRIVDDQGLTAWSRESTHDFPPILIVLFSPEMMNRVGPGVGRLVLEAGVFPRGGCGYDGGEGR